MANNRLTVKKTIIIIILFYLGLTVARLFWVQHYDDAPLPEARNGVLDLTDWEPTDEETRHLNGEWEFYPDELLSPDDIQGNAELIPVPESWEKHMPNDEDNYGYGTYRLTVYLPETDEDVFGLRLREVYSAAKVFVNGKLVEERGVVSTDPKDMEGRYGPFYTLFTPDTNKVEIVIQVANFEMPIFGGITKPILIGTDTAIIEESGRSPMVQIIVAIIYFFIALFSFVIFFIQRSKKEFLFFGLMLILHGMAILLDDEAPLQLAVGTNEFFSLLVFFILSSLMALIAFLKELFAVQSRFFLFLFGVYLSIVVYTFIFSLEMVVLIIPIIILFYATSITYLYIVTFKSIRRFKEETIFILMFISAYTSNMVWGGLINFGVVDIPYYPFDFLMTVFAIIALLISRHVRLIEENRQQTEELKVQDKQKDIFLSHTSHELRNPLHSMINIAYALLDNPDKKLTEKEQSQLRLLLEIGNRMTYTLDGLLDVSRLEDGRVKLKQTNIQMHNVVSGTMDMVRYLKDGNSIALVNEVDENFPLVYADKNRIIQVLFNLLHNAVKYTHEGTITVTAEQLNRRMAKFSIQDTGIGISKDDQQTIFKMYKQVQSSEVNSGGGLGLGLGIVKELVELHGGEIWVESELNEGTTFHFTIPLADKQSDSLEEKILVDEDSSKNKIAAATDQNIAPSMTKDEAITLLVVDDDPINLQVLESMLASNYHVHTALNGKKALELIEMNAYDLIISDVMMPNMSGYELTREIRKRYTISELPIVLLTARDQTEDIYTGFLAGANDYVVKPVNALELKARIEAFAELQKSIQDQLKMEAAWLQAQIQPHFLFNTLNTIASLSEIDSDRMVKLLDSFGNYLRRSFDVRNTESTVPVQHELELVQSYVEIEQARFGSRLTVEWKIDDDLNFKLPPLSIQPLVENAINHGVLKKKEGGTVNIEIEKHDDNYEITIRDDGVGISQEKLQGLLQDGSKKRNGIGIKNTNHRLIKLYGKGLEIESKKDEGTLIRFIVPVG